MRRPAYAIPAGLLIVLGVLAIILPGRSRAARERGRELLSRATTLADSGRYGEAYAALTQAERALPGDSGVARLMPKVADVLTVTSAPPGARVYLERFVAESAAQRPDSVLLGETPIRARRMARGDYRAVIAKDGFVPFTTMTATYGSRPRLSGLRNEPITIDVRLFPADSAPVDMVYVPGGVYHLAGPAMPLGLEARLDDFWIDKYEVSNEQYQAFVTGGGYRRAELQGFADRSGMPGPRGWTGQEYPQGRRRYPVTDVSWVEAAAYCAARGKRLPTVFEWEKAARNGATAPGEGQMMPWGYGRPGDATSLRANFGSSGSQPVDAYPFGISIWGAYNMAGNVKEWTANPVQGGYGVTGGSWEDQHEGHPRPPGEARGGGMAAGGPLPGLPAGDGPPRRGGPARPGAVGGVPAPLRPLRRASRHKIRYVALEGDTTLAYLYLPKQAAAPFQTMVYLCSSAAFLQVRTVPEEVDWAIGPNIRAGRAVLAIVFKGMAERAFGPGWEPPAPTSVRFRDLMVLHATELRRGLDYLATRADVDMRRLAFVATSWGAGSRLPLAAVDDRFRAMVFIGGGIDERMSLAALPEASSINFAPYIRPPKLLLNGRDDEEDPWLTRALPLWSLLREPKQLVLVPGAGHIVPLEIRVPAINRFLDQTLGPVRRAP